MKKKTKLKISQAELQKAEGFKKQIQDAGEKLFHLIDGMDNFVKILQTDIIGDDDRLNDLLHNCFSCYITINSARASWENEIDTLVTYLEARITEEEK